MRACRKTWGHKESDCTREPLKYQRKRQGFGSGVEDGIRHGVFARRSHGDVSLHCPTAIRGHSRIKSETSMSGGSQLMTLQLTPDASE